MILGSARADSKLDEPFTDRDFRRGGRQVGPELVEFSARGDPSSIRIDVWLDEAPPEFEGAEPIYEATLQLEPGTLSVWSTGRPEHEVAVPSVRYRVAIRRVNPDRESDRSLTDSEWFERDDVERYLVRLETIPAPAAGGATTRP